MYEPNTNKTGSTTLREWITTDWRNTPSTTNPVDEEIVDARKGWQRVDAGTGQTT